MNRFLVPVLLVSSCCFAADTPCVILAANEPAKGLATWSRSGNNQKHALTYLAGEYPKGIPFRSAIKDKDVDKIKAAGGRVLVLDPQYTRDDLDKAKQQCASGK